ncbi:hypothetical protein BDF14DRAFT_506019 [Spinellus fusiger]|nr:hypothetical protein BDF14DRAFT_506019 [Spinellus fusiger]
MAQNKATQTSDMSIYRRERDVTLPIPNIRTKEAAFPFPLHLTLKCTQILDYQVYTKDLFALEKLDSILDGGNLIIECTSHINGIGGLASYQWLKKPLRKVMEMCGFKLKSHLSPDSKEDQHFLFFIPKTFTTTPLSNLLERPAPYARLERLLLAFEWKTDTQDRLVENLENVSVGTEGYIIYTLMYLVSSHLCATYPLIFSPFYSEKLTGCIKETTHMAHILQRMLNTARQSGRTRVYEEATKHLQTIETKYRVMQPHQELMVSEDIPWVNTTIGLYTSQRNSTFLRKCPRIRL